MIAISTNQATIKRAERSVLHAGSHVDVLPLVSMAVAGFSRKRSSYRTLSKPVGSRTTFFLNKIWRGRTPRVLPTEPFSIGDDRLANWRHRSGLGG
jgi:hypothetical protein